MLSTILAKGQVSGPVSRFGLGATVGCHKKKDGRDGRPLSDALGRQAIASRRFYWLLCHAPQSTRQRMFVDRRCRGGERVQGSGIDSKDGDAVAGYWKLRSLSFNSINLNTCLSRAPESAENAEHDNEESNKAVISSICMLWMISNINTCYSCEVAEISME